MGAVGSSEPYEEAWKADTGSGIYGWEWGSASNVLMSRCREEKFEADSLTQRERGYGERTWGRGFGLGAA